jgi:hypothetical protein
MLTRYDTFSPSAWLDERVLLTQPEAPPTPERPARRQAPWKAVALIAATPVISTVVLPLRDAFGGGTRPSLARVAVAPRIQAPRGSDLLTDDAWTRVAVRRASSRPFDEDDTPDPDPPF